jgi:hypothetical protein
MFAIQINATGTPGSRYAAIPWGGITMGENQILMLGCGGGAYMTGGAT